MVVIERKTKEERREEILDAALIEFADKGIHGASTEDVAKRAGISQPYVFRLFGTKRELFKAVEARCFRQTLEIFQRAAEGKRGEEGIGKAYEELLSGDSVHLRAQMQAYAACGDPEIRTVVRNGYGDLVAYVERVSGVDKERVASFFAKGMLMNVLASTQGGDAPEPWAMRLLEGARGDQG